MTVEVLLAAGHVVARPHEATVEEMLALVEACDLATVGFVDFTADDVREWLSAPFTKPELDGWTVRDRVGRLVAWAYLDSSYGERTEDGNVYVHPDADPRLYRHLINLLAKRSAERAAERGRPEHDLLLWCVNEPPLERAAAAAGAHKARTFARMRRELDGTEGGLPIPPGVTVTGVDPTDEAQLREFHAVYTEAFDGHFGVDPSSYEAWHAHVSNAPATPYDQWRVARADGSVVGVLQAADMTAEGAGWVRNLGVRPAYRGRGVARVLLDQAFAIFHDRRFTWAGLGVDLANETGAYRLYESVGMHVQFKADAWQLTIPAAATT